MTKWEFYEKAPRPLLRWICALGVLWVFAGADIAGHPLDATTRGFLLAFVCAVYGLRGWEKLKDAA